MASMCPHDPPICYQPFVLFFASIQTPKSSLLFKSWVTVTAKPYIYIYGRGTTTAPATNQDHYIEERIIVEINRLLPQQAQFTSSTLASTTSAAAAAAVTADIVNTKIFRLPPEGSLRIVTQYKCPTGEEKDTSEAINVAIVANRINANCYRHYNSNNVCLVSVQLVVYLAWKKRSRHEKNTRETSRPCCIWSISLPYYYGPYWNQSHATVKLLISELNEWRNACTSTIHSSLIHYPLVVDYIFAL